MCHVPLISHRFYPSIIFSDAGRHQGRRLDRCGSRSGHGSVDAPHHFFRHTERGWSSRSMESRRCRRKGGYARVSITFQRASVRIHSTLMLFFSFTLDLTTRQTFWNMILGNFFIMTWNVCFDQKSVQRIIALPSISHSRRAITLFTFGMCFIVFLSCSTGIIMYAYYYDCDPIRAKVI